MEIFSVSTTLLEAIGTRVNVQENFLFLDQFFQPLPDYFDFLPFSISLNKCCNRLFSPLILEGMSWKFHLSHSLSFMATLCMEFTKPCTSPTSSLYPFLINSSHAFFIAHNVSNLKMFLLCPLPCIVRLGAWKKSFKGKCSE